MTWTRDHISQAYSFNQRRAHAEQHILAMAAVNRLEVTQSAQIVKTYGLPEPFIHVLKELKAQLRNELSPVLGRE